MSLISIRNLAAPLRSKVQIGSLIIVALVVAAIRLGTSGNGATEVPERQPVRELSRAGFEEQDREIVDFLNKTQKKQETRRDAQDPELERLLNGGGDSSADRPPQAPEKNGQLRDIRKSLGLE